MSRPILATKLYIPPPRPKLVGRSRLTKQLSEGLHRKLTLISAPAGFGKTTLVSEWLVTCKRDIAWLSLDKEDNDLKRFLSYLVAALQRVGADTGKDILGDLESPQSRPSTVILTSLLNEIATKLPAFVLVLDDYHVIENEAVDEATAFFLEYGPPHMHIIMTTRRDPNLPLPRLRVRDQLTELRATDLRFSSAEVSDFLGGVMNLTLSAEDIGTLEARTEGWVAGLQLAALSVRGKENPSAFIQALKGDDRYIADYLVEEVLHRQSERVRTFLLETSILDELSHSLCNAVTKRKDSQEMLETLERTNLFITPLGDEREWYRYHHLFTDVLREHLSKTQGDRVTELHRQASDWYEKNDLPTDAVRHAFAAKDFERAAHLVQWAWPVLRRSRSEPVLTEWLRALPDELIRARPVLSVHYAFALFSSQPGLAETYLQSAEGWLDAAGEHSKARASVKGARQEVVSEEELQSLPGNIAVARAYQAGARRKTAEIVHYAAEALELLPRAEYLYRGSAAVLLGLAHWTRGDLEKAERAIAEGLASMQAANNVSAAISTSYLLADLRLAQGRLRKAKRAGQQALKLAATRNKPAWQGTADVYVVLSEVHLEQNDLATATELLLTGKNLGEHAALQETRHRPFVAMARVEEAQGKLEAALELLEEAERLYVENPAPDIHPIAALKARLWLKQDRLTDALAWVRERDLSCDDELSYLLEFDHLTLARIRITQYRKASENYLIAETVALLARLLHEAETAARVGRMIEILVLQTLSHEAQGDLPAALMPLQRALELAEAEGYVRTFVDEGAVMQKLLREAKSRGIAPGYVGTLLAAFDFATQDDRKEGAPSKREMDDLTEALSQRELEVLHLIAKGLSNQEIGERLSLSLSTIKGHNRNIFGKLLVQRRTEAVAKARALNLI